MLRHSEGRLDSPRSAALPDLMTRTPSLILASLLLLSACDGTGTGERSTPLLDGRHAPDVLTESRPLEAPPSLQGNRFVAGWWPWHRKGTVWLVPAPGGALLEGVVLQPRGRVLTLNTDVFEQEDDAVVEVTVGGGEPFTLPLASPLEIPVPEDLPPGRFPVGLHFPEKAEVAVDAAGFDSAVPPGEVSFEEDEIVQSGWSAVDFVRVAHDLLTLTGSFEPPREARPDQEFLLSVERPGEPPQTVFHWTPGLLSTLRGSRRFEIDLASHGGDDPFLRIRLLARGQGPPGHWRALSLHSREPLDPSGPEAPAQKAGPPAKQPSLVVLYVLDALRADFVGHLGGDPRLTPTLDRLAGEGITFGRHTSVAPNTLPSTKSLFTGRAYIERGDWKLPADGPETLAQAFAAAGYETAAFPGNPYLGNAHGTVRGFDHVAGEVVFRAYPEGPGAYSDNAERVQKAAIDWLDRRSGDAPAFLYVHTMHPHNPYDPPEPFHCRFGEEGASSIGGSSETLLDIKHGRREVDAADEAKIRALYGGGLAYNDAQIALFIEELKRRYPAEEILLVVTSDHGEELFDHDGVLHGYTLYRDQLEIPLLFWWPGHLTPRHVEHPTTNLDLHDTLRELVGAAPSADGRGRSLWPSLTGDIEETGKPYVRFAAASSLKGGVYAAWSERYKLILAPRTGSDWGMGQGRGRSRDTEYLFDLTTDPGETVNLAGQGTMEAAWLRSRLLAWVERGRVLEAGAEVAEIDEETRRRLEALGYLD